VGGVAVVAVPVVGVPVVAVPVVAVAAVAAVAALVSLQSTAPPMQAMDVADAGME
jgi:hypothetical protein